MMMRVQLRYSILLLLISLFLVFTFESSVAESVHYRDPLRIDGPLTLENDWDSKEPAIIEDSSGNHHIFWVSQGLRGSTIAHGTLDIENGTLSDIAFVNEGLESNQRHLAVTLIENGSFAIIWFDDFLFENS